MPLHLFQRYAETLYKVSRNEKLPDKNIFQRIFDGSNFWQKNFKVTYSDIVGEKKVDLLNKYFQQRHLLAHCHGIVDDEYIRKTNDKTYKAGQRLNVVKKHVLELITTLEELVEGLKNKEN